jgi:anaerobic selenocysteine-containing dehydrogenase
MKRDITRRDLFKLTAASAAVLAAGTATASKALAGTVDFAKGGKDFSPETGAERQMIPSACWNCVTRDAMVGYVENDRLVKLEGHPDSIRGRGKICAKGAAGINQLYDPDRVLYPMRRVGKRGEGKWKRVSWDEALNEVAGRLKKLKDEGHEEKFMFHYGRMKASSSKIVKMFLSNYGTKTVGNHTSICEGGKWTAQELTWGKHYDNWDFDNTKFVLNFGSGVIDAHTNHIPTSQRLMDAMVDRGVRCVTFDVQLSNTAAKSTEWVPIKPGTDGAVAMAMCREVMNAGLYDKVNTSRPRQIIRTAPIKRLQPSKRIWLSIHPSGLKRSAECRRPRSSPWRWNLPKPNPPAWSAIAVPWPTPTATTPNGRSRRWPPLPEISTTPAVVVRA